MTDVLVMVKAVLATTATRWLQMTEALPIDLLISVGSAEQL